MKDYVNASGGFSNRANRSRIFVIQFNGKAQRTKRFLWFLKYPDIYPGCEIIVPEKELRDKFSINDLVSTAWATLPVLYILSRI